jgi:CDP-diacylglycerol---serine O-phosphatidyltransferase
MTERKPRKHFSMIRSFAMPDFLTLGNGVAGTASILSCCKHLAGGGEPALWLAFGSLPLAAVFDYFDGRLARWRHASSALGAQLDSLADLISFGVAPAVLGYTVGLRGGWDAAVLLYFVACGLSRLARYNVTAASLADETGKVRYFEGTPIPTSLLVVAVLFTCATRGSVGDVLPLGHATVGPWEIHWLVLLFFVSGSAMISKTLHVPKV